MIEARAIEDYKLSIEVAAPAIIDMSFDAQPSQRILVGTNKNVSEVLCWLQKTQPEYISQFIGYFITDSAKHAEDISNFESLLPLNSWGEITDILKQKNITEIIFASDGSWLQNVQMLYDNLNNAELQITIDARAQQEPASEKPLAIFKVKRVSKASRKQWPIASLYKRGFDVIISFILLVMLSPLFVLISVSILINMGYPILYFQKRVGRNGKTFSIAKFRSMLVVESELEPRLAHDETNRITPVGKWLRRFYLDELPQLWNVFMGEMSLIGPRPERPFFVEQIVKRAPDFIEVLTVKPGITGWAQVKNGYTRNLDQMIARLRYDQYYIRNQSIGLDIKILFRTVILILLGKGQ